MSSPNQEPRPDLHLIEDVEKQIAALKHRIVELERIVAAAKAERQLCDGDANNIIAFPDQVDQIALLQDFPSGSGEADAVENAASAEIIALPGAMRSLLLAPQRPLVAANGDDFTLIKGISDEIANALVELDLNSFAAIAAMSPSQVADVSSQLDDPAAWRRAAIIEQAAILASGQKTHHAQHTEDSLKSDLDAEAGLDETAIDEPPPPRVIEIRTEPLDQTQVSGSSFLPASTESRSGNKLTIQHKQRRQKLDFGNLRAAAVSLLATVLIAITHGVGAEGITRNAETASIYGVSMAWTKRNIEKIALRFYPPALRF